MKRRHEHYERHFSPDAHPSRRTLLIGTVAIIGHIVGCSAPSERRSTNERDHERYPVHENVIATVFWVGEGRTRESVLPNDASAWDKQWVEHYGGVDTLDATGQRNFVPKENPYYFALPFSDYTEYGPKPPSALRMAPWYDGTPLRNGESILKNRWIKITHTAADGIERTTYAQWEDVGPTNTDDTGAVFGNKKPRYRSAGLDLSPAAAWDLALDGRGVVSWQFVDETDVPDGPWRQTITTSPPSF